MESPVAPELLRSDEYNQRMTRRVLWKLDLHILPPLALLWLANFIDRSNIGNARIAGLEHDTHLNGNQFNIVLAVFYVPYLLVEMPSNWILKKMGADRWIPLLVLVWGIVTTMTCLVQNFAGLVSIRMALGLCEGGLLPGIVLYLSSMYKRHELQFRLGVFYAAASLAGAFGGLLATGILNLDGVGGLAGWRWFFILEGFITVTLSIVAFMFLPADLGSAKFFTPEEREFALARFRKDHGSSFSATAINPLNPSPLNGEKEVVNVEETAVPAETPKTMEEQFEWREVIRGITEIQCWLTGTAYFGVLVSLYSFSLFLPTIVADLGYEGSSAQLHTVPPYTPAVALTVIIAVLSDRFKWRGPFVLICLPVSMVGYIVEITARTDTGRYAAVFLMAAGVYPAVPCLLAILPNNNGGHFKKATSTALQLAIANCAGFVATFAYTEDQAPRYIRGHSISLAFVCMAWVLIGANVVYCKWENKARAEGRRASNTVKYQALWDAGLTRAPIGDRDPDFRFTI